SSTTGEGTPQGNPHPLGGSLGTEEGGILNTPPLPTVAVVPAPSDPATQAEAPSEAPLVLVIALVASNLSTEEGESSTPAGPEGAMTPVPCMVELASRAGDTAAEGGVAPGTGFDRSCCDPDATSEQASWPDGRWDLPDAMLAALAVAGLTCRLQEAQGKTESP